MILHDKITYDLNSEFNINSFDNNVSQMSFNDIVTIIKDNKDIIKFLLADVLERKCSYLYWPILPFNNRTFIFTNAKNDDKKYKLIKTYNSDMIMKLLTIYHNEYWSVIDILLKFFSNTLHVSNTYINNNIYVFKVNDILSYLNKIDYDLSKAELFKNVFNTIYYKSNNKKNTLCYIERDIMIIIILKKLIKIFRFNNKTNRSNKSKDVDESSKHCNLTISNSLYFKPIHQLEITEDIIKDQVINLDIQLEDNKYNILLEPRVHIPSKRLYKMLQKYSKEHSTDLDMKITFLLDVKNNGYLYYSNYYCTDFGVINYYPYFYLYKIDDKSNKIKKGVND